MHQSKDVDAADCNLPGLPLTQQEGFPTHFFIARSGHLLAEASILHEIMKQSVRHAWPAACRELLSCEKKMLESILDPMGFSQGIVKL